MHYLVNNFFLMKYFYCVLLLLINLTSMAQLSFTKTIDTVFFGVNIANSSADAVLKELYDVSQLEPPKKGIESVSLSTNMALGSKGMSKKRTFSFKILGTPIKDLKFNLGYIKIGIGEVRDVKKIIDIESCLQFSNKEYAELAFIKLIEMFSPVSTLQKIEDEDGIKYAEFSTRKEGDEGIRDITIFLGKPSGSDKYEIRLLPYNEFAK